MAKKLNFYIKSIAKMATFDNIPHELKAVIFKGSYPSFVPLVCRSWNEIFKQYNLFRSTRIEGVRSFEARLVIECSKDALTWLSKYKHLEDWKVLSGAVACPTTEMLEWYGIEKLSKHPCLELIAIEEGNLENFKWLEKHGYLIDKELIMEFAFFAANIDHIEYFLNRGFEIKEDHIGILLADGRIEVLDWIKKRGIVISDQLRAFYRISGGEKTKNWLKKN